MKPIEYLLPEEIERRSFEIISREALPEGHTASGRGRDDHQTGHTYQRGF